jgi:RND superfamily putative drug exporter
VAVYARDSGLTGGDRAKAAADRAAFTRYAEGSQVPPAILSGDGKALLLSFPLAGGDKEQSKAATQVKQRLADGAPAGLRTALTGSAGAVDDIFDAFKGMDATLLLVTGAVVILLLLLTYRSPVLWLVPLLSAAVASQLASAAVYLLARHGGLTVDFQSQSVLTVLVFGVGVDYALLLVARYREELRRHPDRHEAMALALRRSFPAVLASAATVAAALLFLLAAELPSTRGLGPVGAVGIAAALVAMTTLLPALLVLGGRWLFWPFVPRYAASEAGHDVAADHGVWGRLARGVGRRPRPIWIGSAAALLVLTLGIGNLSIGLPAGETFTRQVGSVDGQHLVERHFPGGASAPADVLTTAASAEQVAAAARGVDGVAEVRPPERSADGRWARIPAVLAAAPESRAAKDAVDRLRAAVHAVPGSRALVGGDTAATLDTERTAARDDRVVMPLILAVVLLVLVVLLRALVAPLLLLASVVLTYAAALGAAGLALRAVDHPRLYFGLPLQAFLYLVALGVDYTIFLMTRAREEAGRLGHRPGVLHALTVTGGVVTSAGLVLAATFSALGVLPLVPSLQTAVVVALGVLLDTLVVRSLLVPALAVDLGARVWWPSRLGQRQLPAASAARGEPTRVG